jgi:hypothetical protein
MNQQLKIKTTFFLLILKKITKSKNSLKIQKRFSLIDQELTTTKQERIMYSVKRPLILYMLKNNEQ